MMKMNVINKNSFLFNDECCLTLTPFAFSLYTDNKK
ncbi:Hypothetical protein Y17_2863 [Pectobacterium wasabiae CFBP 3304]|nr:Hypothetical protein Y17_2863 [Pectobacterium wasabiae CFBP 3304]